MKIKWFGHSCFLITTSSGTKILTDPFDSQVGYSLPDVNADVVTTSHSHYDHGYVQVVKGTFLHLSAPGKYEKNGVNFKGILTYHDKVEGKKRGSNIIFIIEADGLRICHCGDVGHLPDENQINEIGKIDILMLPVGGIYTVGATEACQIMKSLNPAVTIPMHYKTPALSFELDGVDNFLIKAGLKENSNVFAHGQEIDITYDSLKNLPDIFVLDYN